MSAEAGVVPTPVDLIPLTGNYHESKPLFVGLNGEYLLCAAGCMIRKISAVTGELVGSFNTHVGFVTSLRLVDEFDPACETVVSTSLAGEVLIWRHTDLVETLRLQTDFPIYDAILPLTTAKFYNLDGSRGSNKSNSSKIYNSSSVKKEIYLVIGKKIDGGLAALKATDCDKFKLVLFDFDNHKIRKKICKFQNFKQSFRRFMIAQYDTEFLLGCDGGSSLFVWNISSRSGIHLDNGFGDISCFSASHDGSMFVSGHANGALAVWYNMNAMVQKLFSDHSLWNSIEGGDGGSNSSSVDVYKRRRIVDINQVSSIRPVCTRLHWHSLAVKSVSFNGDATYIYSGGEEGVLVIWHLATHGKSFLPRLGEHITYVEANRFDSKVAITTGDNAVRGINVASIREEWCLQAVSLSSSGSDIKHKRQSAASALSRKSSKHRSTGDYLPSVDSLSNQIKVDPHTELLFSNGFPGKLQIFDPDYLSLKQSIDVVQFVRVSKKEADSVLYLPNVTKYAILRTFATQYFKGKESNNNSNSNSNNNSNSNSRKQNTAPSANLKSNVGSGIPQLFIATVDVYRGEELSQVSCLKFWSFNEQDKSYVLNTQVEYPHGDSEITDISFSNAPLTISDIMCCTSSSDGYVKMWKLKDDRLSSQVFVWNCIYSFNYREGPISAVKFSRDNSILVVASDNIVTLWDPVRVELRGTLVNSITNTILQMDFIEPRFDQRAGSGSGSALLAVLTKHSVSVFDLITMSLKWTLQGRFSCLEACSPSYSALSGYSEPYLAIAEKGDSTKSFKYDKSDKSSASKGKGINNSSRILFVNPTSGKLINAVAVPERVSSLCFRESANGAKNFPIGVFILLESGEFYFSSVFGARAAAAAAVSEQANSLAVLSKVFTRSLPSLQNPDSMSTSENKDSTSAHFSGDSLKNKKLALSTSRSTPWLRDLLDENTSVIPPVSALFDSLLANIMQKKQGGDDMTLGSDEAPAISSSGSSSSSSGGGSSASAQVFSSSLKKGAGINSNNRVSIGGSGAVLDDSAIAFESNLTNYFKVNIFHQPPAPSSTAIAAASAASSSSSAAKKNPVGKATASENNIPPAAASAPTPASKAKSKSAVVADAPTPPSTTTAAPTQAVKSKTTAAAAVVVAPTPSKKGEPPLPPPANNTAAKGKAAANTNSISITAAAVSSSAGSRSRSNSNLSEVSNTPAKLETKKVDTALQGKYWNEPVLSRKRANSDLSEKSTSSTAATLTTSTTTSSSSSSASAAIATTISGVRRSVRSKNN